MAAPARVVSLVPSLTELIFWLGRGDTLVGRTRFCDQPENLVHLVPIIGGTKNPNVDKIVALCPDIVIANKEENRREDIEALIARGVNVRLTDPNTVVEAVVMIEELGTLFDAANRSQMLANEIRTELGRERRGGVSVFAAVWRDPLMGLGGESYGNSVLEAAGGENVLRRRPRYPEITMADLEELKPRCILLPDEPYRFTAKHLPEFAVIAPAVLIDGKLLWWYGPRIPSALRTLRDILAGGSEPTSAEPDS
jgi:ABC-type Fe3+-hydroxamate transport system substrate-binding protein